MPTTDELRTSPLPADVLLADGSIAVVRQLGPEDGPALHRLHDGVSDDAIRMRFFNVSRRAAHEYVDHVTTSPQTRALVAEQHGRVVALVTMEPLTDERAEVAFLVADDARGLGVGTLLLEHVAAWATDLGITELEADVLAENHAMLSLLADAGLPSRRAGDGGVVVITRATDATEDAVRRADDREFRAEARSLRALLRPRSVAVAGVRADGSGVGAAVLRSIEAGGFTGRVTVVHPRGVASGACPVVPSLRDVDGPLDLVVACVPAAGVVPLLRDAVAVGARAMVVVSSGFAEVDDAGAALQHDLAAMARAHDVRLVGPNCLGLLCNQPDVALDATFQRGAPPRGGLAVASQSGGVGIVVMDRAREVGLGVGCFVSLGNKADVSSNDLLAAWYDDEDVTAAALYLESFGNAAKFARFARRFARRKPLLAVVGGRSAGGARGGASHTAAVATPAVGVDALFQQSGVIACHDADDLVRTARLLAEQPRPRGRRVGIVSNAGGLGVLAADAAVEVGLEVPALSSGMQAVLASLVHGTTGTSNPVDVGAGATPAELAALVRDLATSGEVDTVLVLPVATGVTDLSATLQEVSLVRARRPDVPVVAVPLGGLTHDAAPGLPVTTFPDAGSAMRSVAHAARYDAWLGEERHPPVVSDPHGAAVARRTAARLLAGLRSRWLVGDEPADLLSHYGLDVVGVVARSASAAARVASETGFPVAIKVTDDPAALHRTERGLVATGLATPARVRAAYRGMRVALGRPPAVHVQPMVAGVEIAVGLVRDPTLGPMLMVAAGGTATELSDDRVFLLPPVSRRQAERAVGSLRVARLLAGYRGSQRCDVEGLVTVVTAVGRLAVDVPEVAEVDLNPVIVGPDGSVVVDAAVRLAEPAGPIPSMPRQLRRVR